MTDLFESIFVTDRMSAFDAVRRYPKEYVHFSRGIGREDQRSPVGAKLGVNPSKRHNDPYGIYFYYNKWLLHSEDVSDSQYAVEGDHYWVCSIKKSDKSINLAKMSQDTADSIAKSNGWFNEFEEFKTNREQQVGVKIEKKLLRTVGGMFWAAMDYIANVSKFATWGQMLRGVDALYDPGKGIINANEPCQVIVFNKSLIRVLDHGDNKDQQGSMVGGAMRGAAQKLGGTFSFANKVPTIRVTLGQYPLTLTSDDYGTMTLGCFKQGHWVEETDRPEFGTWSPEAFEEHIIAKLQHVVKYCKAEISGKVSKWNKKSVKQIIGLITAMPLPVKQFVRDGTLKFTSGWDNNWGGASLTYEIEVTPDDGVDVKFCAGIGRYDSDARVEVQSTFGPEATPQKIANTILQKILDGIAKEPGFVKKDSVIKYFKLQ